MTPRIPPLPPEERDERTEELLAGLMGFNGRELNIFTTLARHPKLFRKWSDFGGQLLFGRLPFRDRELLILRTGHNCRSDYEWAQHVALARQAGVTDEEIERVRSGPNDPAWSPHDALLLRAADELHETFTLSDGTWAALAAVYDEQQLIELPMLVGQYHLVAFTLNALGVEIETPDPA